MESLRSKVGKIRRLRAGMNVYAGMIKMHFLSGLQYKGWWLMVLQVLLVCVTDPLPTLLMFQRMGSVGQWSMERILLIYALTVTSFGLAESLCRGFDYFPWHMLRTGDFDRLLLRPCPLFIQVASSVFHIHRMARAVSGLAVVLWLLHRLNVPLTPANIALLILTLAGGTLTYTGVFVLTSGIAIFTIKALDWIYILTNASYQVCRVPVEYMPKILRRTFTFILPVLVVSYYPASVLCGWGEPLWKGLLAFPAGVVFLCLSLLVWRFGVRHYRSTGS
jgi:ABC-2 type transport system permease protein